MIMPLGDDNSDRELVPWVNYSLIVLNVFVFVVLQGLGTNEAFTLAYATVPEEIVTGRADEDTLASLLLANLTTVVSFGLIAISQIPSLAAIGRVVAPGALLALLLSAAFARARAPSGVSAA